MIEVSVKDFGPIIRGTVELKPLTIFVGPSNTGKSYMATLVYALERSLGRRAIEPYEGFVDYETLRYAEDDTLGLLQGLKNKLGVDDRIANAIGSWVEDRVPGAGETAEPQVATLPGEVQSLVERHMERSVRSAGKVLGEELQRCYGPMSDIRRRGSGATGLRIAVERDAPLLRASYEADEDSLTPSPQSEWDVSTTPVTTARKTIDGIRMVEGRLRPESQVTFESLVFLSLVVEAAAETLFADFIDTCYYLPAARSGIALGHKAIAGSIVKQSSSARALDGAVLPGIVADFISHMLDMERFAVWRGGEASATRRAWRTEDAVDFLERKVIRGKVDIDLGRDATRPTTLYDPFEGQPEAGRFPVDRTSSMVSELAPVVLFLRYLVRPGSLVVLEEPESHLHPAGQRQMARGIVRLVNAGVKVIITTHSDYFVGQINNLLKLSSVSKQKWEKEGYEASDCLKPENVSAYHFVIDDDFGGSVIEKLEIEPDFGIDEQEFTKVAEDLYEETVSLQGIRDE